MIDKTRLAVPYPTQTECAVYLDLLTTWTDPWTMADDVVRIHRQLDVHWDAIPANVRLGMGHRLFFLTMAIAAGPALDEDLLELKRAAFARALTTGIPYSNIALMLIAALENDERALSEKLISEVRH